MTDRRERELGEELADVVQAAVFQFLDEQPEIDGETAGRVAGLLSRSAPNWLRHVLTSNRFAAAREQEREQVK